MERFYTLGIYKSITVYIELNFKHANNLCGAFQ